MHYLSHTTQINSTPDQPLKAWMITLNNSVKQKQTGFCHFPPFSLPPNWLFSLVNICACACEYYCMYLSISLPHYTFAFSLSSFSSLQITSKQQQKVVKVIVLPEILSLFTRSHGLQPICCCFFFCGAQKEIFEVSSTKKDKN